MLGSWQAEDMSKCRLYEMCSVTAFVRAVVHVLQCCNVRDTLGCRNVLDVLQCCNIRDKLGCWDV